MRLFKFTSLQLTIFTIILLYLEILGNIRAACLIGLHVTAFVTKPMVPDTEM